MPSPQARGLKTKKGGPSCGGAEDCRSFGEAVDVATGMDLGSLFRAQSDCPDSVC